MSSSFSLSGHSSSAPATKRRGEAGRRSQRRLSLRESTPHAQRENTVDISLREMNRTRSVWPVLPVPSTSCASAPGGFLSGFSHRCASRLPSEAATGSSQTPTPLMPSLTAQSITKQTVGCFGILAVGVRARGDDCSYPGTITSAGRNASLAPFNQSLTVRIEPYSNVATHHA